MPGECHKYDLGKRDTVLRTMEIFLPDLANEPDAGRSCMYAITSLRECVIKVNRNPCEDVILTDELLCAHMSESDYRYLVIGV